MGTNSQDLNLSFLETQLTHDIGKASDAAGHSTMTAPHDRELSSPKSHNAKVEKP